MISSIVFPKIIPTIDGSWDYKLFTTEFQKMTEKGIFAKNQNYLENMIGRKWQAREGHFRTYEVELDLT